MTSLQEECKKRILTIFEDIRFEILGPSGDEHYYSNYRGVKIYLHSDSAQFYGPKNQARLELEDFSGDQERLIETFISRIKSI